MSTRARIMTGAFAMLAMLGTACGGGGSKPAASGTPTTEACPAATSVDAKDFVFAPKCVTVKAGDTVTWNFVGATPHTVTADDGSYDSGQKTTGTFQRKYNAAGTYPYYCTLHGGKGGSGMAGTVTVTA